ESVHARFDCRGGTYDGARQHALHLHLLNFAPVALDIIDRRLAEAARATEDARKRHLLSSEETPCLLIGFSSDDVNAHHCMRLFKLFRWLEAVAIDGQCREQQVWCEVRGKGIG